MNSINASSDKLSGMSFSNNWIIDTGASNHMTGNLNFFSNTSSINTSVGLPNGAAIFVIKIGSVLLDGLSLDNVLYVPSMTCNLLLVSQLNAARRYIIIFTDTLCVI